MCNSVIRSAGRVLGSMAALARAIGVQKASVSQWANGADVPIKHCVAIEKATNGVISRKDLRPNDWQRIWPELTKHESAPPAGALSK